MISPRTEQWLLKAENYARNRDKAANRLLKEIVKSYADNGCPIAKDAMKKVAAIYS